MKVLRRLGLVTLIASVAACGDAPPAAPGTGGTNGTGATPGTGGTGATGGSGGVAGSGGMSGAGGTGGSGGVGGGVNVKLCLDQADVDAITALYPTSARQMAAQCAGDCAGQTTEQGFLNCANPCIEEKVAGLSSACASCYADLAWCTRFICQLQCAANACSILNCRQCPGYPACFTALNRCAGRDSLDCVNENP